MIQSTSAEAFQPLRPIRSSHRVADQIWKAIAEGRLGPGDVLPPERTLAKQLQVTRNTVREATRSLEQLGLVSIRQGRGVTVLDYLATAGVDCLGALLATDALGGDFLKDVWEARVVLGKAMLSHAIERFDLQQLDELDSAVARFAAEASRPAPDRPKLQDLEFDVHGALLRGGGNRAFAFLHNSLRRTYEPVAHLFEPIMDDPVRLAAEYQRGLELLKTGKRRAATEAFCASFVLFGEQAATATTEVGIEVRPEEPK
ncbi:MAG: FadR family transcriptional regulator [Deltaproteobacteria bacterium]|jgi:DNA-binding FadR family transcriptional regulator|nr:FadR family transcriptional regulator [Deltaproteobacteria bacterium]MBW2530293.1 FadR family transcriptional regulator [Deltaproteobacteria bacterium]